jgi:K+-transporting ATPase KdpF subunit
VLRRGCGLRKGLRAAERQAGKVTEDLLLLLIAAALMVYLVYALLRPEKF